MMKILITFLFINLSINSVWSQDEITSAKSKDPREKTYKYDEFQDAVRLQVEKQLERLGRGKIIGFSKELMKKEDVLKLREIELEKKEEQLQMNASDFKKKVITFQGRQVKFLGCLDESDKQRIKRITHMVDVVSGMKPVSAAAVLSVQDADISIKILGMLPPEKVSKIFNLMKKEISARLQKQYMTMKK
jgi:flagellar motility protein MotE (MotC chaperone)